MVPPDFGRSVNPISTRGGRLCPPNNTGTPRFSDLPTALQRAPEWSLIWPIFLNPKERGLFGQLNTRLIQSILGLFLAVREGYRANWKIAENRLNHLCTFPNLDFFVKRAELLSSPACLSLLLIASAELITADHKGKLR